MASGAIGAARNRAGGMKDGRAFFYFPASLWPALPRTFRAASVPVLTFASVSLRVLEANVKSTTPGHLHVIRRCYARQR